MSEKKDHPFYHKENFPPCIYTELTKKHKSIFFKAVKHLKKWYARFYYNKDHDPIALVLYNLKHKPKTKIINLKEITP